MQPCSFRANQPLKPLMWVKIKAWVPGSQTQNCVICLCCIFVPTESFSTKSFGGCQTIYKTLQDPHIRIYTYMCICIYIIYICTYIYIYMYMHIQEKTHGNSILHRHNNTSNLSCSYYQKMNFQLSPKQRVQEFHFQIEGTRRPQSSSILWQDLRPPPLNSLDTPKVRELQGGSKTGM